MGEYADWCLIMLIGMLYVVTPLSPILKKWDSLRYLYKTLEEDWGIVYPPTQSLSENFGIASTGIFRR